MSGSYKQYPDLASATQAAEALGRLYCASIGKSWPERPDIYGPGLQPQPPSAFYQRYWQAPQSAIGPTALDPGQATLPIRMVVDAVAQQFNGQQATITSGAKVTLDFTGLASSAAVGQQSASINSGP